MVGTSAAAWVVGNGSCAWARACSTTMPLSATFTLLPPAIVSGRSGTPEVSITRRQAGANSSGGRTQSIGSSWALNNSRNESSITR